MCAKLVRWVTYAKFIILLFPFLNIINTTNYYREFVVLCYFSCLKLCLINKIINKKIPFLGTKNNYSTVDFDSNSFAQLPKYVKNVAGLTLLKSR